MIHRRFNPALCLAWIVMGSTGTELGRQGNVYQEKTNPMANWVSGTCLLSQHSVHRARRPELMGRLGHIVRTAYPQKIKKKNQKKEKMRQTNISALVRLRQVGDCECKASLSYSETLPNNKPIKRLLSEMHGQDEVSNGLFR